MKFTRLILRNLSRNKRRTILTVLSVAVALFLFATLHSVLTTLGATAEIGSEARLVARNRIGITFPLRESQVQRIAALDGIESVTWANWFGGVYINTQNYFAQFAVDSDTYFPMYPEIQVPEEQMAAFMQERTAAIMGAGLMERFGWTLGQTVTLQGTIVPGDWEFVIRGVYEPDDPTLGDEIMYFHYEYLYERSNRRMAPGWFILELADPGQAAALSSGVDALFENSTAPTKTETEKAFQAGFVTMWGNIAALVRVVGTAVFFAILFVAANTMMMSARERVGEVAVMKALGFPDGLLSSFMLIESVFITVFGGLLGLLAAMLLFAPGNPIGSFLPGFMVRPSTVAFGIGIVVLLGLVSGAVPAWQAARLSVVQALRRVA